MAVPRSLSRNLLNVSLSLLFPLHFLNLISSLLLNCISFLFYFQGWKKRWAWIYIVLFNVLLGGSGLVLKCLFFAAVGMNGLEWIVWWSTPRKICAKNMPLMRSMALIRIRKPHVVLWLNPRVLTVRQFSSALLLLQSQWLPVFLVSSGGCDCVKVNLIRDITL